MPGFLRNNKEVPVAVLVCGGGKSNSDVVWNIGEVRWGEVQSQ